MRILEYVTLAATRKNLLGTDFHARAEGVNFGSASNVAEPSGARGRGEQEGGDTIARGLDIPIAAGSASSTMIASSAAHPVLYSAAIELPTVANAARL